MNSPVDHLVYAATDLECCIDELQERLGVRAAIGGQHPGRGTHNALLALSGTAYLELVAPDPAQAPPAQARWFGIDGVETPRLVGWAAKAGALPALHARARAAGIALGPVASGSRRRADGTLLQWQFTDPATQLADGLVPFFIDWGNSPHPAAAAPRGLALLSLRAEHPQPSQVTRMLAALGIDLPVERGPRPALIASLKTPRGRVELR